MKYGADGVKACNCFDKEIVPKWSSKFEPLVEAYFAQFKPLAHRAD